MAFGPPPDITGNIAVAAICASTCDSHTPTVQPNPNGAYPGVISGHGGAGAGNGSAGSPSMGFPVTYCKPCPKCKSCEESAADSGNNAVPDKSFGITSHGPGSGNASNEIFGFTSH